MWFTFPATEIITALMSFYPYFVREKEVKILDSTIVIDFIICYDDF